MSSFIGDISSLGAETIKAQKSTSRAGNTEMKMEDFLKLMVVQLQSQTIDDTADTGEMLNQLVQMQMVTALSNMTDASVMSYASSLVGKEVTIATVDKDNNLQENVLNVIGTGLYSGQQVIFCDDGNMYQLNQIMAVGRLPEEEKDEELSEFEQEVKDRVGALNDDIINNPEKYNTDGTDNSGSETGVGAVNGTGTDSTETDNGVVDPLVNGPDGIPSYDGTQGGPKDEE